MTGSVWGLISSWAGMACGEIRTAYLKATEDEDVGWSIGITGTTTKKQLFPPLDQLAAAILEISHLRRSDVLHVLRTRG